MRWLLTLPAFGALALIGAVELRAYAHPDEPAEALPVDIQDRSARLTAPPAEISTALIRPASGSEVYGLVRFWHSDAGTTYDVELYNVPTGAHGFHVHENGDCSAADASSAGDHFNPQDAPHAGPTDPRRHIGDLGNLTADADQKIHTSRTDPVIRLTGEHAITGRALVIHAEPDDLSSQPSGAAGARIGCGLIQPLPPSSPPERG